MRPPRTRFAAPLVITLAIAPACVVTPAPPSNQPTPTNPPRPEPAPIDDPPPPEPDPTTPQPPEPEPEPTPTPSMTRWSVYQRKSDQRCYTAFIANCSPKATCNPPPPREMDACPEGITADARLTIEERTEGVCVLVFPTPESCAKNPACNPPRPRPIDCPTW